METAPRVQLELPSLDERASRQVVVADDDTDVRELVRITLSRAGYEVIAVCDGPAALAAINRRLPDLLVLDVMMPGASGIDVCREVRADRRSQALPIIMLTARAHVMSESEGLIAGADMYLTKPFSPRALLSKVEHLLTL
jgi:DNA-binding response OmpR family regulator